MSKILHARRLKPAQFDKAFALIQFAFRQVSLDRWRRHVEAFDGRQDDDAGWLAVEDDKGYIHGLLAYRIESDLICGRILTGRDIILGGVALGQTISCAIAGLSQMARRTRCDAIHIALPGYEDDDLDCGVTGMKACLLRAGYVDRGSHLCRCLCGRCKR
jgi:hypothetical protein